MGVRIYDSDITVAPMAYDSIIEEMHALLVVLLK